MAAKRQIPATPVGLATLGEALAPYPAVSKRTLRNLIAAGKLPASKIGGYLFVSPAELAELFRPKLRGGEAKPEPAVELPRGRLSRCPTCSAMSTNEHQEICAS